MKDIIFTENWHVMSSFLPRDWQVKARTLGAFNRQRNIKTEGDLLRILLIHLVEGKSLRETVNIAKQGGLSNMSDVALLKRLRSSSEWFRWMSVEMLKKRGINTTPPDILKKYNIKSVDASSISEPGSTGADWRLHYSLNLYDLHCDQFIITKQSIGENLNNFKINAKDLIIGDRVYGKLKGMKYVKENNGDFILRLKRNAFTMKTINGKAFDLIKKCRTIKHGQIKEWDIIGSNLNGLKLPMRICVIRKSEEATRESIKRAKIVSSKKQFKISPEALELHGYVIVATSLPKKISAKIILEIYRYRWLVEIAFKRLKSILNIGHLPKIEEESCRAWLHGKFFIALLAQAIVDEGRHFSPWGYLLNER